MTDEDAILKPERAPEHGPDFWSSVDRELGVGEAGASDLGARGLGDTAEMAAVASRGDVVTAGSPNMTQPVDVAAVTSLDSRRNPRRLWPLAAAAALFAVVGLGFLVSQRPASTETQVAVAADSATADGAAGGQGEPADDQADADNDDTSAPDTQGASTDQGADDGVSSATSTDEQANDDAQNSSGQGSNGQGSNGQGADGQGSSGQSSSGQGQTAAGASEEPTPSPAPAIPDFASAPGAVGDPDFVPLDQGLPEDATFLANWPQRDLSWYAVTDSSLSCDDSGYSDIRYVNGAGLTLLTRDPQLRFSGELSHFVLNDAQSHAAWISACGTQLELFVGELDSLGQITELTLAWLGEGSPESALVLWDDTEVNLNAIEPGGTAFAAAYDLESRLVSRNGGPSRIMVEAGAPAQRSLTPIAASADGRLTYWTGAAPAGTISECPELFGSGQSDTMWLRSGEGQWQLAAGADFPLGTVTAAALEPERARLAFADQCPEKSGRVLIGIQQADGTIAGIRAFDLTPYVPGFVGQLHWVDESTLRIETDNTEYGFGTVRFDIRLADDPSDVVIVQLD